MGLRAGSDRSRYPLNLIRIMPAEGKSRVFMVIRSFCRSDPKPESTTNTRTTITDRRALRLLMAYLLLVHCGEPLFGDEPISVEITELQEYVVKGVSEEKTVNPLAGPVGSVYGTDQNILGIPRGVSVITQALIEERNVDTLDEIIPFTPSAFAPNSYGNATTPTIRGDVAENYVNGQRRSGNEYGIDLSFNAIESIDIVRGPGSVVYGPGFDSGGYVNFVTKRPSFDEKTTTVKMRLGTWIPGGDSFIDGFVRIDHNHPLIQDRLALRLSYEGQESETLYTANGGREDYQDIYLALSWKPSERFLLDFNAQYVWQVAPQHLGANRPYDGLTHDGLYLNGEAIDFNDVAGDGFSLRTTVTGTTPIENEDTLLSRGDFSNANIVYGQLIARWHGDTDTTFINRTFVEHINRRRHHEFSYTEYVTQFTFENRTELNASPDWFNRRHEIVGGFTVRYEDREAHMNYFNYYPFTYDITANRSFPAAALFGLFGQPGPGNRLFFGAEEGIPETTDSKVWNPALFWQHEIGLGDSITLLYGFRGNAYFADVTDPLPPAGGTSPWNDTHDFYSADYNISLSFRPVETLALYGTFNRTHALDGSTGGGAIMLSLSDGKLEKDDFRVRSELWEVGVRLSLLGNRLYSSLTAFRQERFRSELGGGRSGILVRGAELEAVFQPDERFYLLANLTYTQGNYLNASPFTLGGADLNSLYDVTVARPERSNLIGPDGQVVPGDYRITGLSRWVFKGGMSYHRKNGLGFNLWGDVRSPQNGNILAQYTIPTQFTLNASIIYRRPGWEATVSFLNFTNETNWIHNGDDFGSVAFIGRELPFRVDLHLKYYF